MSYPDDEMTEAEWVAAAEAMIRENDENPAVIEHRRQNAQRAEADARLLERMREIKRRTLKAHPHLQ